MTARVFVDTNVIVYSYDSSQPLKQARATEWLTRLWRERSGRTSVQVLNELYVTLTRRLSRRTDADEAWDAITALIAWDPQPIDRYLLVRAHDIERRYRLSWWDSLIVGAAQLQDCDLLLSEDLQAGMRFGQTAVVNPFAQEVQEAGPSYAVIPPSRHRPRGRPRRISHPPG